MVIQRSVWHQKAFSNHLVNGAGASGVVCTARPPTPPLGGQGLRGRSGRGLWPQAARGQQFTASLVEVAFPSQASHFGPQRVQLGGQAGALRLQPPPLLQSLGATGLRVPAVLQRAAPLLQPQRLLTCKVRLRESPRVGAVSRILGAEGFQLSQSRERWSGSGLGSWRGDGWGTELTQVVHLKKEVGWGLDSWI